jgi:transposase InsO family protein
MSSRLEFVMLARAPGANVRALCRAHGISPKTAYKLLRRFEESGIEGLQDRSRRPRTSPNRTASDLEAQVLALHEAYPYWGAGKLRALLPEGAPRPHHNTIAAILKRHGRQIVGATDSSTLAPSRFEHEAPNLLWQMDFKGHFALTDARAGRCHPLTVIDDHSRFALCLQAFSCETHENVQAALTQTFRRYGLPQRITCDNGGPWRIAGQDSISRLEAWLIRLGIRVSHSRPYHPQTQGKDERFHRTLKLELIDRTGFNSFAACQAAFDRWRDQYNLIRPHGALGQKPPGTRYAASARPFPEHLPPLEYNEGDSVIKVRKSGQIQFERRSFWIGEGLADQLVALRPSKVDGVYDVFFCEWQVRSVDLRVSS